MYILPNYYLLPSINVRVPDKDVRTLCLLCIALWSYFCIEVYCSVRFFSFSLLFVKTLYSAFLKKMV